MSSSDSECKRRMLDGEMMGGLGTTGGCGCTRRESPVMMMKRRRRGLSKERCNDIMCSGRVLLLAFEMT
jgi:hypothetical protein